MGALAGPFTIPYQAAAGILEGVHDWAEERRTKERRTQGSPSQDGVPQHGVPDDRKTQTQQKEPSLVLNSI